jgi:hypothetical protein
MQPSGIAIDRHGPNAGTIYFTQIPTPGVAGGDNGVFASDGDGNVETLHLGEPEPTDITVTPNGNLYWTCKSAGVILVQTPDGDTSVLLSGRNKPQGIATDRSGRFLFFTEVPTPGVSGSMGGMNAVYRYDLRTGDLVLIDFGDPEPADITVLGTTVYWTCASAGVIVEATLMNP